jgi:cobalt-zinc-cadmium efflux system membrane fusion protein
MTLNRDAFVARPGNKQAIAIAAIVVAGIVAAVAILRSEPAQPAGDARGHGEANRHPDHAGHGQDAHHEKATKNGPHGGDLFAEGDFGLEVQLAEEGGDARLKVWLYQAGQPLPPTAATVTATLNRPGGETEEHVFVATKDGLQSVKRIAEPQVFDATVAAQTAKAPYRFTFSRHEGRVAMADDQVEAAGITLDTASAAPIRSTLQLPGEIRFNEDRTAHIVPRVSGVVESVPAHLGQQVKKGQVLAVISSASVSEQRSEFRSAQQRLALARTTHEREKKLWEQKISPEQDVLQAQQALREAEIAVANANQRLAAVGAGVSSSSLGRYELRAPFDGMVVEKHISLGESVKEDANVFTLSDLSTVWAEMSIGAKDLPQVRVGEKATVRSTAFDAKASGTVSYVGVLIGEQTRTAKARVTMANPQLTWRPGLFVNVEVTASETNAPVTVSADAIQMLNDKPVVFLKVPGGFIPQPVQVGRADRKRVEIVSGLRAGARYAAAGSFVLKSEHGKGSAMHTH